MQAAREEVAAEVADNAEMREAEHPAQESPEPGTRTPITGEHQAALSRTTVQVSRSPDCSPAETFAISLLFVTSTICPHSGVWL